MGAGRPHGCLSLQSIFLPLNLRTFPPSFMSIFLSSTCPIFQSPSLPSFIPSSLPSFLSSSCLPYYLLAHHTVYFCEALTPKPRTHLFQRLSSDRVTVATIMFKINK